MVVKCSRASSSALLSAAFLLLIALRLAVQWPIRGFWYDETVNAYLAGRPWGDVWEWCTRIDNQMPLDFALRKLWGAVVGTSEFALRGYSTLLALVAAAVMTLGRRVSGGALGGWLAAGAFALTQSFVYAAYEVRP